MSEDILRRFMQKLNTDSAFRDLVKKDWEKALDEFDLSPAEVAALATQDADALRRLMNADVSGYAAAGWWGTIGCTAACVTSACPNTPGSRRHCGTGQCPSTPGSGGGCGTGSNCGVVGR